MRGSPLNIRPGGLPQVMIHKPVIYRDTWKSHCYETGQSCWEQYITGKQFMQQSLFAHEDGSEKQILFREKPRKNKL